MATTTANTVSNPLAQQFNVVVSIPQAVNVKLVDASLLNDFEIWMYLSSVLLNISTGFWVSYSQNTNTQIDKMICWTSICFTFIFAFTIIIAISKRVKMNQKSRNVELATSIPNPAN
ncbi:MAG: hypothetical protein PHT07_12400 [Paludibacter sp.]|nr:hypothetical protein [Paludibacter sp.]